MRKTLILALMMTTVIGLVSYFAVSNATQISNSEDFTVPITRDCDTSGH